MPFPPATGEEVFLRSRRGVFGQQGSEVFRDGDASGCQLAFGVAFADDQFRSDLVALVVGIDPPQGAGFVDASGGVEADAKEGAVAPGK